eukprot:350630-Chlamydomonas_euryale.AAC.1
MGGRPSRWLEDRGRPSRWFEDGGSAIQGVGHPGMNTVWECDSSIWGNATAEAATAFGSLGTFGSVAAFGSVVALGPAAA